MDETTDHMPDVAGARRVGTTDPPPTEHVNLVRFDHRLVPPADRITFAAASCLTLIAAALLVAF